MPLKQVEMDATGLTCKVALGKRRNQSLKPREGLSGSTMESKSKEESRSQQRQGCATIQGVLLKHPIMTGSAQLPTQLLIHAQLGLMPKEGIHINSPQ